MSFGAILYKLILNILFNWNPLMVLDSTTGEVVIAEQLKQFLLVLSVSLGVATLPQIFSWLRRIPYTLLLVIVGLGLAFVNVRLVNLSPELILMIFLPPLLFEAAWNLKWSDLELIRKQKLKKPFALSSDESMSHKSLLHLTHCTTHNLYSNAEID